MVASDGRGLVVGGDGHKYAHTLVVLDRAGREHGRFAVANTVPAIEAFVENLTQLQARATGEVQVVLEDAQGHGALLAPRLVRAGLGVVTRAPALVAQRRRRATIHASKSDVEDAQLIAKVALVEPGQLRPVQLGPADREALADLPRVRRHLVTERTATLNLLHRELHRAYPSYRGMFRDPWRQAAQRVWVRFPTPAQLDGVRRRTLVRVLKGPTGRGLSGTAIERVWHEVGELRRHRMPPPGALARVIPLLLGRLAELDRQLAALEAEMAAGLPAEGRLLTTIPGVRTLPAATLLVAIKDVRRFASSDALARFAGGGAADVALGQPRRAAPLQAGPPGRAQHAVPAGLAAHHAARPRTRLLPAQSGGGQERSPGPDVFDAPALPRDLRGPARWAAVPGRLPTTLATSRHSPSAGTLDAIEGSEQKWIGEIRRSAVFRDIKPSARPRHAPATVCHGRSTLVRRRRAGASRCQEAGPHPSRGWASPPRSCHRAPRAGPRLRLRPCGRGRLLPRRLRPDLRQ